MLTFFITFVTFRLQRNVLLRTTIHTGEEPHIHSSPPEMTYISIKFFTELGDIVFYAKL